MSIHQVKTFKIDEGGSVVGRAGRVHHTHDGESQLMAVTGRITVSWVKLVTKPNLHLFRDTRSNHGLKVPVLG